jgi:hypothetical protein
LTVCGLPGALEVTVSDAVREPAVEGVKVTLTVQVPLGTTEAPEHVSALLAKSPALVPVRLTLEIVRLAVPVLVSVIACGMLVVPTS